MILGCLLALAVTVAAGTWSLHVSLWPGRFAPARTGEFIIGVITAICFQKCPEPSRNIIRACLAGGFLLTILSACYSYSCPVICLRFGFLTAPGAALLIFGLAFDRGWLARFLSSRLLVLLGMSSFAFYLIHDLAIRVLKGIMEYCHISINASLTAAAIAVILFAVVQVCSIGLFKMVEVPIQRYLRGCFRKSFPSNAVAADRIMKFPDQRQ
jgi:peptidoglycan/LPS O-acetylase OafA/YrhL